MAPTAVARTERPREFRAGASAWTVPGVALFSVNHRHLQVVTASFGAYSLTLPRIGCLALPEDGRLEDSIVTRAEEYLAAHLAAPVSAVDVAASLGVSVRSLSRAFRVRHGMGAMGFLKERRFEAARRSLATASRESATVTTIAGRYGFMHLGRFSAEYRKRFGEFPSETLAR